MFAFRVWDDKRLTSVSQVVHDGFVIVCDNIK